MTLSNIYKILNSIEEKDYLINSSNTITQIKIFKQTYAKLESTKIFDELLNKMDNALDIKLINSDAVKLPETHLVSNIMSINNNIKAEIKILKKYLSQIVPTTSKNENVINIKLEDTEDMDKLNKNLSKIRNAITPIICHEEIKGELKVNHWEYGSYWIELSLQTSAAITIISQIVWSAVVIMKKIRESELVEKQIKATDIKNESLEDIMNGQKKLINSLIEAEARHIYFENIKDKKENIQYIDHLKNSIDTFSQLILKGTEIHPSLEAPKEVKEEFPEFDKVENIFSKIKQISEKTI